jgi:F0F1-type ATP synthase delta subunit
MVPRHYAPPITQARARIASLSRSRAHDDPDLAAARRDLAAAKLERYVEQVIAAAPPLTSEQLDRIVSILRPAIGRGDAG